MRLPRTIQLDPSDRSVFDHAAEPGEWAVTGSFAFLERRPGRDHRQAAAGLPHGFLGLGSFGWSTFVMVSDASDAEVEAATEALAQHFVARHGAPGLDAARRSRREEIAFAESLCEHPLGTMLTVFREHGPGRRWSSSRPWPATRDGRSAGPGFGQPLDLRALARDRA